MTEIVSEARVTALRWKRGTGYFGAHKHEQPYSWEEFQFNQPGELLAVLKSRYESYIMSWLMFHKQELNPDRLDLRHGATILERVKAAIEKEVEFRRDWDSRPTKKAKKR